MKVNIYLDYILTTIMLAMAVLTAGPSQEAQRPAFPTDHNPAA